jgi:hypothetical protein
LHANASHDDDDARACVGTSFPVEPVFDEILAMNDTIRAATLH